MAASSARLSDHHAPGAAAAVAAVVSGVVLFKRQNALNYPVVPVDLLADRTYRLSVLTSICCYTTQMTAYVTLPFHLQRDFGFSVLTTGFVITGWPVGVALMALLAGKLVDRYSPVLLGTLGLSVLAIGFLLLTTAPVGSSS